MDRCICIVILNRCLGPVEVETFLEGIFTGKTEYILQRTAGFIRFKEFNFQDFPGPFSWPFNLFHDLNLTFCFQKLWPTTLVTLCWNTSLNVTIHLPESAALPPLNVE